MSVSKFGEVDSTVEVGGVDTIDEVAVGVVDIAGEVAVGVVETMDELLVVGVVDIVEDDVEFVSEGGPRYRCLSFSKKIDGVVNDLYVNKKVFVNFGSQPAARVRC